MSTYWPTEDGWPYADPAVELPDIENDVDEDLLALRTAAPRLLSSLDPLEREVLDARFGLEGHEVLTMKQLHLQTGLPRADLRSALGSGLEKLRTQLR
jgi:DNA-directed RNA polymerase sigma subunit (sigma70/sigma32)